MGAPGQAAVCAGGHVFHWVESDLVWDEDSFKRSEAAKRKGCPCGQPTLITLCHYGDINDCLPPPLHVQLVRRDVAGRIMDTCDIPEWFQRCLDKARDFYYRQYESLANVEK